MKLNNPALSRWLLPAFATAVALTFAIADASGQQLVQPPLVTVSGQAEVRVPPDEVLFNLDIESIDKDILTAKQKTDDLIKGVFVITRKNKVADDDVQTSNITVSPKYNTDGLEFEQRRNMKRVFLGYQVAKSITVRLREVSRFDEVLSDILKAGVTRLNNVEFLDSQDRKHKDQARAMAIKAAQEKAMAFAREIGQAIGPAYSIDEGGNVGQGYSNFSINGRANTSSSVSDSEPAVAFAPGLISVTAQVTVRFRLQ